METERRLKKVFARTFNVPEDAIGPGTMPSELTGWDSLGQLRLMMEVEQEFQVSFAMEEVVLLNSFEKILEALERKLTFPAP